MTSPADRDSQIIIIGAGPSGLATALFLKRRGYTKVLVLEKLGRVGGLCSSITCEGRSFDLGANYVTPAYKQVRKLANEYGAKLYAERPFVAMKVPADGTSPVSYQSMFRASRYDDKTGKTTGVLKFLYLLAKYTFVRWRLGGIIDRPTFAGIENHADLCQPMDRWLSQHGLEGLTRVFELPTTMMGYGQLDETPALYALKFMTVKSFVPMAMKEAPFLGKLVPWPKRFQKGFQRFWETISWDLEVRLNVNVVEVDRSGDRIRVTYEMMDQELSDLVPERDMMECDHIIFACPQSVLLGRSSIRCDAAAAEADGGQRTSTMMKLTPEERELFEQICETWYCMTTYHVTGISGFASAGSPLAAVYPLAPILHPRGVAQQWKDNPFVQFYSPISPYDIERAMEKARADGDEREYAELKAVWDAMGRNDGEDPVKDAVLENVRSVVAQMGGTITEDVDAWHTYNRWTYFQHVSADSLLAGFYSRIEKLQGQNNTYYVGGATNFELVEPVVEYSKNLVERHFPRRPTQRNAPSVKSVVRAALLALPLLMLGYCALVPPPDRLDLDYPLGAGDARASTEAFWQLFQADSVESVQVRICAPGGAVSGDTPGAASDSSAHIICKLENALRAGSGDITLPNIAAAAYNWRVQSAILPEDARDDLSDGRRWAARSAQNGNKMAPGFEASPTWLLGFLTGQDSLKQRAYRLMIDDTRDFPAFHGFVEGASLPPMLNPERPDPAFDYQNAIDAFLRNVDACIVGDGILRWVHMPEGLRMNRFLFNAGAAISVLAGRRYCYNNTVAPFNMQGLYVAQGDAYLKQGNFELARIAYANALVSPDIERWVFRDEVEYRLNNMESARAKFLRDTGILHPDPDPVVLVSQSTWYCASCHYQPPGNQ